MKNTKRKREQPSTLIVLELRPRCQGHFTPGSVLEPPI